jgi:hypothetical protein
LLKDVEIAHSWAEYNRMNGNHADDGERKNNETILGATAQRTA